MFTHPETAMYSKHYFRLLNNLTEISVGMGILSSSLAKISPEHRLAFSAVISANYEMSICRAIERFELYTLDMASEIRTRHVAIALKNIDGGVKFKDLAEVIDDYEALKTLVHETATDKLSVKGLTGINEYFKSLGIPVISDSSVWWVGGHSIMRNVIVHQGGKIDDKAEKSFRNLGYSKETIEAMKETIEAMKETIEAMKETFQEPHEYKFAAQGISFIGLTISILENAQSADQKLCKEFGIPAPITGLECEKANEAFSVEDWFPKTDTPTHNEPREA